MALVIDPESEVRYRVRLVEGYLREAEENFKREDFRATVAASQLAAENAAKAIIAIFRIPSWSHDPSHELREVISQLPQSLRPLAEELAGTAQLLAPEHGRVTYGEPTRGLTVHPRAVIYGVLRLFSATLGFLTVSPGPLTALLERFSETWGHRLGL